MFLNMEIFGGIGADADTFINRNISNVISYVSNVCDGLIKINNYAYMVNQKQELNYYSRDNVSAAYVIDEEYFIKDNTNNPIIYDRNNNKYILVGDEQVGMDNKVVNVLNAKHIKLSTDEIEFINDFQLLSRELNIDDQFDLFDNGINNTDEISDEGYINKNIYMLNAFIYWGFGFDLNNNYENVNGINMENSFFCQGGLIFEFYPDYLMKMLSDGLNLKYFRTSYSSERIGKYSNYSDKLIMMTVFLKFKRLWVIVSIDLKLLISELIIYMRSTSNTRMYKNKVQEINKVEFSFAYFMSLLNRIFKYFKGLLWILRSFSIGYDMYNTLLKLSCDVSSCSVSLSAYQNLYC